MIQKIKGRRRVVAEAERQIDLLISRVEDLIKGAESEYLFYTVYLFPNIFARLAEKRRICEHYFIYDITWLRATNGLSLALNRILPKYLPLKHPSMLSVGKLEKTIERNLPLLLDACYDIGKWLYILGNRHIDRIIVDNGKPKPYHRGKGSSTFQEYVDKVAVDEGYARWLSWFYRKLGENYKLISAIDEYFRQKWRFGLYDVRNASIYLQKLVESGRVIVPRNEVHQVFTKNVRSGRADRLLKELTFNGSGKDLFRSSLIPLRGGYFLIARWVFSLGMHFESWVRLAIESDEKIRGIYSDFIGKAFEEYVKDSIMPLADVVRTNIKITRKRYSEIERDFEIDMLAIKGDYAFLISCKGGKKELPKLQLAKMWAEFPEREIRRRIMENKKEIKEIWEQYKIVMSNKRILEDLDLEGRKIIPSVVYAMVQPLSLESLRKMHGILQPVLVVTIEELKNVIANADPRILNRIHQGGPASDDPPRLSYTAL